MSPLAATRITATATPAVGTAVTVTRTVSPGSANAGWTDNDTVMPAFGPAASPPQANPAIVPIAPSHAIQRPMITKLLAECEHRKGECTADHDRAVARGSKQAAC